MPAARMHAAFLRGVMPMNCKMPALRAAFEHAGFTDVRTVLGSGNVVFRAAGTPAALATRAEAAMAAQLGRSFATVVRTIDELAALIAADPFAALDVPGDAKRVATFVRVAPRPAPRLPVGLDGACLATLADGIAYSYYQPSADGPVFMRLIEKTLGDGVTTRTWDTVRKVVVAGTPVTARAAGRGAAPATSPPTRPRRR